MTALVFAPPPRHFYAFPLVVQWQAPYEALDFYFPKVQFGLLENQPQNKNFTSLLQPPRQKDVPGRKTRLLSRGVESMAGLILIIWPLRRTRTKRT